MIVLGGNAFAQPGQSLTMAGQFRLASTVLHRLVPLMRGQCPVVITHGNGPQVGHMLTRVEESLGKAYAIPLEVCVAESQGELGFVLQQSLHTVLSNSGSTRSIAGLLTQVIVDQHDPAFEKPTKPIGPFYSAARAAELEQKGFAVHEDAGRGYRRVVPSPRPLEIVETDVIRTLLAAGIIVIAVGGGGIPVVRRGATLVGVGAVVDKDLASAVLGEALDARLMVIVTGVACAYRFYGTSAQTPIGLVEVAELRGLAGEGHFAPGSMQPKVDAVLRFCSRPGTRAIICSPDNLESALRGESGTIVVGKSSDDQSSAAVH
jgi:carbamate kinase